MRRLALLFGLLLIATAGATPMALGASDGVPVPFKAQLGGDEVAFGPPSPARCPEIGEAADVVTAFSGTGHATHLGLVSVEASHCTDLDTGRYGDGMLTITAANDDVLMGTYTDGLTVPVVPPGPLFEFADTFTFIDGGSGRFAFATGGGTEEGLFNAATFEWSITMSGEIAYGRR